MIIALLTGLAALIGGVKFLLRNRKAASGKVAQ